MDYDNFVVFEREPVSNRLRANITVQLSLDAEVWERVLQNAIDENKSVDSYVEFLLSREDWAHKGTEVYGKSPGFTAFKKEQERQSKLKV